MPPNGWKWVVLAVTAMLTSMVGAAFHVVPGEVAAGVLMGVLGLFARSPMQNGGAILPEKEKKDETK